MIQTDTFNVEEVLELGEQLNTMLVSDDDYKNKLQQLKSTWGMIAALRQKQRQQLKADIEAISQLNCLDDQTTSQIDRLCSEESELVSKIADTKNHIGDTKNECQMLADKLTKAQNQEQQLCEKVDEVKNNLRNAMSQRRFDVGLYTNITNIRWQYDSGADYVKGFVCDKNNIKPFDLNRKEHSKFFMTNYLWDLIDEDW
ncbi:hypothetical protein ScPMuIL_005105 [Solemya velum]